jgi:hypothetical protein
MSNTVYDGACFAGAGTRQNELRAILGTGRLLLGTV